LVLTIDRRYGILVGMILNLEDEDLYLIECSDWQVAITSESHEEACTEAITHMLRAKGGDLKISCVMISTHILEYISRHSDKYEHSVFHATSRILANAGYHKISKDLKQTFGT
jgi:hypothetical protein